MVLKKKKKNIEGAIEHSLTITGRNLDITGWMDISSIQKVAFGMMGFNAASVQLGFPFSFLRSTLPPPQDLAWKDTCWHTNSGHFLLSPNQQQVFWAVVSRTWSARCCNDILSNQRCPSAAATVSCTCNYVTSSFPFRRLGSIHHISPRTCCSKLFSW